MAKRGSGIDSDLSDRYAAYCSKSAEHARLADSKQRHADWKHWGPYVSERAWGTVREDYSGDGNAWGDFPHDQARSRVYRWNEDGLGGVCNRFQNACLAVALWNGKDPILKERLFGLTNQQGNHGEDVKEYYFYLDSTPTHSYMRMLYRYPQEEFPYQQLVEQNQFRSREEPELELCDLLADSLRERRFFDVEIEYAKQTPEDLLCRITVTNQGPEAAEVHVLPHLWFRNTWSWRPDTDRPELWATGANTVAASHKHLGQRWWSVDDSASRPRLLFVENETNTRRLYGDEHGPLYAKDGIHDAVIARQMESVNPEQRGTKVAAHYHWVLQPGESRVVKVRFTDEDITKPFAEFDAIFTRRKKEADEFYAQVQCPGLDRDERQIQRQAFAGLMWSKQFYHYSPELWLKGDPLQPAPPASRQTGRNSGWQHLTNIDVVSMPDKWEYPWYAAWDLAFHMLPIAMIDPEWAKRQLVLMMREWYMHPNGQIPAYEWNFSDVNPPVHAWAVWRVYKIARNVTGVADTTFLQEAFHKLLLNFTWWVNRKDSGGRNVFQGGFLGLDNIGVFDRSRPLAGLERIEQADGTGWMGMYCLNMLAIALELARHDGAYEAVATKFFEHFVSIAHAINATCGEHGLWDDADGFYYDVIHCQKSGAQRLKTRSFVGLVPLFAVETIEPDLLEQLPRFRRRLEWFLRYRPHLVSQMASLTSPGENGRLLLSIADRPRLTRMLERIVDPAQFLSPYGLRSLSREYGENPYSLHLDGSRQVVRYEPGESTSGMFGGNSNWRGPIWFPVNYLMIESLQKYQHYYGDSLRVAAVGGHSPPVTTGEFASELSQRLIGLFTQQNGHRAVFGDNSLFQTDPLWQNLIPFHEYFHGDSGAGLGASHQTGWTALVAKLLQQVSESGAAYCVGSESVVSA